MNTEAPSEVMESARTASKPSVLPVLSAATMPPLTVNLPSTRSVMFFAAAKPDRPPTKPDSVQSRTAAPGCSRST